MRHILFAITMLMLCLSVNGQELKVTGSRKAIRTSGGEFGDSIGNPRLARAETRRIHRGYDIGRNLCAEIPSEERAARLQR